MNIEWVKICFSRFSGSRNSEKMYILMYFVDIYSRLSISAQAIFRSNNDRYEWSINSYTVPFGFSQRSKRHRGENIGVHKDLELFDQQK